MCKSEKADLHDVAEWLADKFGDITDDDIVTMVVNEDNINSNPLIKALIIHTGLKTV